MTFEPATTSPGDDAPEMITLPEEPTGPRLITHQDVVGWMAHWAVRQHPYGRPDGLFDVLDLLAERSREWPDGVTSLRMWRVSGWVEIERWLDDVLKDHPALAAWNTPRSGHIAPFVAVSRYFGPKPEDDFIDIDALIRNVARCVWRGAND